MDDTADAVAVKVTLVRPVPIVTELGIVTVALDDVNGIAVLDGAGLPKLSVQVLVPGVWIEVGEQARLAAPDAAVIVRLADRTMAPAVAVMVALPDALAATEALNPAEDDPAGIASEAGTVTCGLLLPSDTLRPPAPAGPLKVTAQALELPAATVSGVQLNEASETCPVTASEKFTEVPL